MRHPTALQRGFFLSAILYSVLILISQAAMSIGAAFFIVFLVSAYRRELVELWQERTNWRASPWFLYLELGGALIFAIIASLVGAKLFPLTYNGVGAHFPSWSLIAKAWYFIWPPLLAFGLARLTSRQQERVLWSWLICAVILGAVGIVQYWTGWPRPQIMPQEPGMPVRYHATLFLGHHLSVASILIFPFFVLLDQVRMARQWHQRLALLLGSMLVGGALVLTFSRTLWVGLCIGLLFWVGASVLRSRWGLKKTALVFVAAVLFLGLAVLGAFQFEIIRTRFGHAMGIAPRLQLWKANWEFFTQRPLTGVGWLQNEELSAIYLESISHGAPVFSGRAHNNALEILAQLGIVGFGVWVVWSLWITVRFWRIGRLGHWGLLTAWIVFQINGLTQVNQWEGKVLHQLCWVLAWSGLWWAKKKKV